MDADRALFGVFMAALGVLTGYLHGRQHNVNELETLRGIVRDNQQKNLERIEAARGKQNDQAE